MKVTDIVKKYLKDNGFDGLCNDGCGCGINGLQCCAEEFESCRPAYLIKNPDCKNCKVTDCYYCGFSEDLPEKCYKEEKPLEHRKKGK